MPQGPVSQLRRLRHATRLVPDLLSDGAALLALAAIEDGRQSLCAPPRHALAQDQKKTHRAALSAFHLFLKRAQRVRSFMPAQTDSLLQ